MERLSGLAKSLAGKSDGELAGRWLPLWIHALDTAEAMARLVNTRLSGAARAAIGLDGEELSRVARFLGAAHDLGKATAFPAPAGMIPSVTFNADAPPPFPRTRGDDFTTGIVAKRRVRASSRAEEVCSA